MTIIAYRDGVIAADTLVTHHGSRVAHTQKIFRVNGWLIGASGTLGAVRPAMAWVLDGADLSRPIDFGKVEDAAATFVSPEGVRYYVDTGNPFLVEEVSPFTAMGSGADVARGAMFHGATAVEAVEAAISIDISCGGQIHWLGLDGSSSDNVKVD